MPSGPVLTVVIVSATEGLDKGLKEAEKKIGGFSGAAGKLGKVAKVAAPIAGVAAAVAKLGAAGDKANTAVKLFGQSMENAGIDAEGMAGPIADAQKASKALAFSGGQTRDALVSLATATGDAEKSAELLAVAQDVARMSGADLTTTADAVAKAYTGNDRALKALIPGLTAGATGMDTIANASAAAAGQADIFADSGEAAGIKTKNALKGLAITVGKALAPAFRTMLDALLPVIESLSQLVVAVLPVLVPLLDAVAKVIALIATAFSKALDIVTRFVSLLVSKLMPLMEKVKDVFGKVADVIGSVSDAVNRLIGKIQDLLGPLGSAVDKLKNLDLNPFNAVNGAMTAAAQPSVSTLQSGGGSSRAGGVNITIIGDPAVIEARVTKALRDYSRRNGAGSVFTPGRS